MYFSLRVSSMVLGNEHYVAQKNSKQYIQSERHT